MGSDNAVAMTSSFVGVLVGGMLVSGCANSLLTKYQDMQCVADCDTAHPKEYNQPIYQTIVMFAGEMLCLFALYASRFSRRAYRQAVQHSKEAVPYKPIPADELAGDSGVVLSEDVFAPTRPAHIKPSQSPPNAQHGPIPTPTAAVLLNEVENVDEAHVPLRLQLLFWLPAFFDICGTTLMNLGLFLTPVSIYQMTRGALVLFVGLFSVLFLHRRLSSSQWGALFVVMLGVAVVGLSSALGGQTPATEEFDMGRAAAGVGLILFAQIFTASQFVVEEKILTRYSIEPLRAVGLEGVFGLVTTALIMFTLHAVVGGTSAGRGGVFDIVDGWHQLVDNRAVWTTSCMIAVSIACFNYFGLAVTRSVSAAARSTIDTCRTVGIWAVSLFLGWESFRLLQVVGFVLLVYGTFVFNGIMAFPALNFRARGRRGSQSQPGMPTSSSSTSRSPSRSRPLTVSRRSTKSLERGMGERTPLLRDE